MPAFNKITPLINGNGQLPTESTHLSNRGVSKYKNKEQEQTQNTCMNFWQLAWEITMNNDVWLVKTHLIDGQVRWHPCVLLLICIGDRYHRVTGHRIGGNCIVAGPPTRSSTVPVVDRHLIQFLATVGTVEIDRHGAVGVDGVHLWYRCNHRHVSTGSSSYCTGNGDASQSVLSDVCYVLADRAVAVRARFPGLRKSCELW